MANTQINITENGTTTLATAGKYCDRDINVKVNVPNTGAPTQFTNYYNPENVVIDQKCTASGGVVSYTADTECNYIKIPYHHISDESVVLRMRGIGTVRSRLDFVCFGEDGTTLKYNSQITTISSLSYDEFGDAVITLSSNATKKEWHYMSINFQYIGRSSADTALTGPIITINEPIGNGGYYG